MKFSLYLFFYKPNIFAKKPPKNDQFQTERPALFRPKRASDPGEQSTDFLQKTWLVVPWDVALYRPEA